MNALIRKFVVYICNNYVGNFLGFVIGMASARLISHFFTTRSIRNLWGLAAHKTVVDKHTYTTMEWAISILIGFIVFELVSTWLTKRLQAVLPKYRYTKWMLKEEKAARCMRKQYASLRRSLNKIVFAGNGTAIFIRGQKTMVYRN